MSVSDIVR